MPRRHSPRTLRRYSMLALAQHWDLICYAAHNVKEMNTLIESEDYLKYEGPFSDMPSGILEDLMEVIRSTRSLNRKFLHLLVKEQLLSLNLSLGIGEVYYGLRFLPRCTRLRELNLAYLRHVEPAQLMQLIPHLSSIISLNLMMTSTIDPLLDMISFHCPNLIELNLSSTMISDQGLISLCGAEMNDGVKRCQKLQRLLVSETRVTWIGALTILRHLPNLTDFDFDKIFQVFEHLDPKSVMNSDKHPCLKLRSLYSTAPCVRGDSIDAAATLCPHTEIVSVMNAWIETRRTIDYDEGVLPILQVIGASLENVILNKFTSVDLFSLGQSCPKLRKVALSSIGEFVGSQVVNGLFSMLTILEVWFDDRTECPSENALIQLLTHSKWIESILIKRSDDLNISLMQNIWQTNPMNHVGRLSLIECSNLEPAVLEEMLFRENNLEVLRVWSCPLVGADHHKHLKCKIKDANMDVYFEWFV
ncbi:F-box/LRR-repeat protein 20 [Orchesella cincta]|uniref:F-box/LRR-repeat protein 20 n=1 Tax=Orchesella cincta TaxID=48709 RepID=A0A1D2MYG6_ORCCI|nr:F-box/LRR-repeat protein 20 [Orchesella cincta]